MNAENRVYARAPKLSRRRHIAVYCIAGGVWLTGILWVLFHYFFMSDSPFGLIPHPLELWWLALHGAFAFASLWLLGLLWAVHIPIGWRMSRRRWSGGAMFAIVGWLALSGYALYYVGNDAVRSLASVLHWSVGLATPVVFLLHRFAREHHVSVAQRMREFEARIRRAGQPAKRVFLQDR